MDKANHSHIIDLLPAYALDILEAEEAEVVQAHLLSCKSCQQELAAFNKVVELLPHALPEQTPALQLKDKLLNEVKVEQTAVTQTTIHNETVIQSLKNSLRNFQLRPLYLGAVLIFILISLFFWQQRQNPNEIAEFPLTPTDAAPNSSGKIALSNTPFEGTLQVAGLPNLDISQQYQLWLIKDGTRISAAVFSVSEEGVASVSIEAPIPLTDYDAFGISIEPAGGSEGPTGARVLGYNP